MELEVATPFSPLPEAGRATTHHTPGDAADDDDDSSSLATPRHPPGHHDEDGSDMSSSPHPASRDASEPSPGAGADGEDRSVIGNPFELEEEEEQPKQIKNQPSSAQPAAPPSPRTDTRPSHPSSSTDAASPTPTSLPSRDLVDDSSVVRGFTSIELAADARPPVSSRPADTPRGPAKLTALGAASTTSLPGLAGPRPGSRKPIISRTKVQTWHNMVLYLSAIVFCEIFLVVGLKPSAYLALVGLELVVLGIAPTFVLVDSSDNGFLSRHTVARSMEYGHCGLTPGIWKWDVFAIPQSLVHLLALVLAPQGLALLWYTDYPEVLRWRLFFITTIGHAVIFILMMERRRADKSLARRHEEASFSLSV